MNCVGVALGIFWATCSAPVQPAPTGKAPFCEVIKQAGGRKLPSRKDTHESADYMKKIAAAHKAVCK